MKSHYEAQISILINTLWFAIVWVATFSTGFVLVEFLSAETLSLHTSIFLTFNVFSYSHLLITKIILTPETLSWLFLSTSMYFHFLTINVFSCSHFFNCWDYFDSWDFKLTTSIYDNDLRFLYLFWMSSASLNKIRVNHSRIYK